MDKIKYVLNGATKWYSKNELREYYQNLLKSSGAYAEETFKSMFDVFLFKLKENNGLPYADLPVGIRELLQRYEAITGKIFIYHSRGEIIKDIKNCISTNHQIYSMYFSFDKDLSNRKDIVTDKNVAKMMSDLKLTLVENREFKNPRLMVTDIIQMPPRERYSSSSGWNHDLIHEMTHKVDLLNEFSKNTFVLAILNAMEGNKPHECIMKDVRNGKINSLPKTSREYAGHYILSEIAVEHVAYKMMGRMGIEQEPNAKMKYERYISGYHSLLERVGFSTLNDPKTLDNYVKHTDKLLKAVEKQYELSTGKTVIKPRRQTKDKEIDK